MNWRIGSIGLSVVLGVVGVGLYALPPNKFAWDTKRQVPQKQQIVELGTAFDPANFLLNANRIDPFRMVPKTPIINQPIGPNTKQLDTIEQGELLDLVLVLISSDGENRTAWFLDMETSQLVVLLNGEKYNGWTLSFFGKTIVQLTNEQQSIELRMFNSKQQ